jgi:Uma2 family endonuclease
MAVLTQHRFTVEDYYRMAETGVLRPNARVELLEGQILDMSPIGPFHSGIVIRLNRLFHEKSKGKWAMSVQSPLRIDQYSEPEPDIMLLRPQPDDYTKAHPSPEDVFLLVEVADASLYYDRDKKLPIYGRAGIGEVWIVNLVEQKLEVYREPNFTGYSNKTILRPGQQAIPQAFPDVAVDVAELLKR